MTSASERLFVGVLGNRDSGKSTTWNLLFGRTVNTGKHSRPLELRPGEWVEVFLVSGSPEEREKYVGDILGDQSPKILLCSMQYVAEVQATLAFIAEEGFDTYVQWLNPGHGDAASVVDHLGLMKTIPSLRSLLAVRDGKVDASNRVQEIREFIYGWALYRGLIVERCWFGECEGPVAARNGNNSPSCGKHATCWIGGCGKLAVQQDQIGDAVCAEHPAGSSAV